MPTTRRAAVVTILASLASVFLLDAAIFRTGIYMRWVEADSSTGLTEYRFRAERDRQRQAGNLVLTFGDSRMAYLPRVANQYTSKSGYVFRHAGTAGSSARDWYYLMRDLDPRANRYQAIVIGLDDLEDEDSLVSRQDDPRSLHYNIGRLALTDLWDFAISQPRLSMGSHPRRNSERHRHARRFPSPAPASEGPYPQRKSKLDRLGRLGL